MALPPQAHEVPGTVAMQLLGYDYLASVRKLKDLGEIEGRKIGRDWWYDRHTIDAYNERRRPVGRRPIEDDDGDPERVKMRLYQRERRAAKKKGAKKGAKRAASPAVKGGRAAAGARKSAGAAAGGRPAGGKGAAKKGAAKKGTARKGRR